MVLGIRNTSVEIFAATEVLVRWREIRLFCYQGALEIGVSSTNDEADVQGIVRNALPSRDVERIVPRHRGRKSIVYEVHCRRPAVELILKLYPPARHRSVTREVAAYRLIRERASLPVPAVVQWAEAGSSPDRSYLLMTPVEGRPLAEVAPQLSEGEIGGLYREMGELLARVHQIGVASFAFPGRDATRHGSNSDFMMSRIEQELRVFADQGGERALGRAMRSFFAENQELFARCETAVLCHDDYHEGNVLVAETAGSWRVTGIVDWENAVAAEPLFDIAKTAYGAIRGDRIRSEGFREGYGALPPDWRERVRAYSVFHALDLWNWFASTGNAERLARVTQDLRTFCMPTGNRARESCGAA